MPNFRPQVKIAEEQTYGVAPDYSTVKKVIIDPEEFSITPNQNVQYSETLYLEDAAAAAPGNFEVTGSFTFPVRLSQMQFVNWIGLGQKYECNLDYDNDQNPDAKMVVTLPAIDKLPSFTVWATLTKPSRLETISGVVFNNYRLTLTAGQIVKASFDMAGSRYDVKYDDYPGFYSLPETQIEPLDTTDVAAFQDAGIYADVQLAPVVVDETTGDITGITVNGTQYSSLDQLTQDGYEIIDVIFDSYDDTTPSYAIVGKKLINVKSINLTFNTTTFTRDAHRIGDRFAQEYPMRTIERRDFRCDITVDYTGDNKSFFRRFIRYSPQTGEVTPNQVDIGYMSLVVKIGSPTDVINKSEDQKGPEVHSYDFGWITDYTDPVGAKTRVTFIMPNVVIESVGTVTARPASIPEVSATIRLLLDKEIFNGINIQFSPDTTLTFSNEKLVAIGYFPPE